MNEQHKLDADETIGLEAAAQLWHCSADQMRLLAASGQVSATMPGREWVFVRSVLLSELAARAQQEAQARRAAAHPAPPPALPNQPAPQRNGRRPIPALPT